jgi:hypothetical protein
MKLKELEGVLFETELPITLFTNQLRWGEYDSEEEGWRFRLMLADYVTIKADLKDHINTLKQILAICEAVAKGRYLEDRQRCHWAHHTCEHQCTAKDQFCDSFDDRPPHTAILDWLEECRRLRPMVKEWIVAQAEMQQTMREGVRRFFPDLKHYHVAEDEEGHKSFVEMTPQDQAAYDAEQTRQDESVAARVDQYELNLERIRHLCTVRGDFREIVALINDGLSPKIVQDISPS